MASRVRVPPAPPQRHERWVVCLHQRHRHAKSFNTASPALEEDYCGREVAS